MEENANVLTAQSLTLTPHSLMEVKEQEFLLKATRADWGYKSNSADSGQPTLSTLAQNESLHGSRVGTEDSFRGSLPKHRSAG